MWMTIKSPMQSVLDELFSDNERGEGLEKCRAMEKMHGDILQGKESR